MASYDGKGLEQLDVSQKPKLVFLECQKNKLSELNLLNNKSLEYLDCSSNKLTFLDLSNNKKLNMLYCSSNKLTFLDLSKLKNHLSLVDVRSCKKLAKIILPKSKKKVICLVQDPDFAETEKLNICMDEGTTFVFEYK